MGEQGEDVTYLVSGWASQARHSQPDVLTSGPRGGDEEWGLGSRTELFLEFCPQMNK